MSDPQQLWTAIDQFICTMPGNGKRRRQIVQLQEKLNEVADAKAWAIYMAIEEATNARVELILIEITRWAYEEGRTQSGWRRRG